jgi:hypothetical protein
VFPFLVIEIGLRVIAFGDPEKTEYKKDPSRLHPDGHLFKE